jgi:Cd2+/Zn2+-exporting ATPase
VGIATADLEELDAAGQTPILVARAGRMLGLIGTADELRAEAPSLVQELKDMGVDHRVLLTGDREAVASAIAARLALTDVRAELLPEGKVAQVRWIGERHGPVAMVGDGINDAPALAAADVGIAMGVAGTDAALETADVALMRDDLSHIPAVVDLGRRTLRTVRANIALSLATKVVFFGLAVVGLSTLWMAVLADVGASLVVTLYSLRLLRHNWRQHDGGADDPGVSAAWRSVAP